MENSKQVERQIRAHDDDVNAVCYLDDSGHVLLSGSDDSLIKVWDLRQRNNKAQGLLSGHLAGITSLSARADGMTIASNSKDQTLKIWPCARCSRLTKYRHRSSGSWQVCMFNVFDLVSARSEERRVGKECGRTVST